MIKTKVRDETPAEELARLIREQARDMKGQRDYWPWSGRHTRAASLEEAEATQDADEWDDPTGEDALACLEQSTDPWSTVRCSTAAPGRVQTPTADRGGRRAITARSTHTELGRYRDGSEPSD